jgi:hypothetical protein
MAFYQELKIQRERFHLTPDAAASRFHLARRDYADREKGRVDLSYPEKFGLLVGLGVPLNEAARLAEEPDGSSMSEWSARASDESIDPFVRETESQIILSNRTDDRLEYPISKSSISSPRRIFDLVSDLCGKSWVTRMHIKTFLAYASEHLDRKSQSTGSKRRF